MILATMTVYVIERKFAKAAVWSLSAAVLSFLGLMHSWQFTKGDTVVYIPLIEVFTGASGVGFEELVPAWEFGVAYLLVAGLLLATPWVTRPIQ